ncbi:cell division protein FtsB [Bisgaardia hudsonensis]|uniref:Cell division protein FtsB n=1 Tax=Bisgaardia hudsonensis TaxID=109472 RepID=A0A4R2N262_9PAST|nr:cell division protein FtsB [Bisgaardia hudsonensis]QLB12404.1 cell division protein FtsB [Bisgaardia hudsonensis]TCP13931.1 cell division protein FtsB [Bisgaardia hudsonensis]
MRIFIFILLGVLTLFQYEFWFGKNGYIDNQKVLKEIAIQKVENDKLRQRNDAIFAEIKDLKNGVAAIEEKARMEHKLMKSNEIFYRVIKQ